jgi:hypothetical protein
MFHSLASPCLTPSMRAAMNDLGLHKLFVIYPGTKRYALGRNMEVLPVDDLPTVGY